ncbi:hypothetical protein H0H81_004364 [Sphagnurus paluster]|uniref:Uncharacterized protein n=1 Tax=Sphagnurus paluster TaxID=117069 RepID=A0A9P7FYN7_9AGAR|nr:hypothetical protein H0H81_004364 [Sphagnurus paluster]
MVNVNSALPFNLHNKPRGLLDIMNQGSYLASSSRSASTSTSHEGASPHPHPQPARLQSRSGLHITPLHSSQSRSRSRSHSQASAASVSSVASSSKSAHERKNGAHGRPAGVLGLRLVRGSHAHPRRRGRPAVKRDVDTDTNVFGDENAAVIVAESVDSGVEVLRDVDRVSTLSLSSGADEVPRLHLHLSPSPEALEFRLNNVGTLSASWGEG